jgi:hypothetical protein
MERSQNPVWTQCLGAVEPVLQELGFRLTSESHLYASFGSASAEYERSDMKLELFWDGKENWIFAHYSTCNRNQRHLWDERKELHVEPPATNIRAHVLRPGVIADEYIANVVQAIRKLATGPRSLV